MRFRGIAAITAVWLVVCGVLAMRHEARVAHVDDGAGGYVHASALAGAHRGGDSDIHAPRDADGHAGHCALLAAFHQAASAATAAPQLSCTAQAVRRADSSATPRIVAVAGVYRFAPKTSPPRAA